MQNYAADDKLMKNFVRPCLGVRTILPEMINDQSIN